MALIDDFPVVDMGELAEPPDVMPLDWKFRLSGGREIVLIRIQQHRTYGGMLCGLPWNPEMAVVQSIAGAQKWDGRFHAAPVVIPASIVSGTTPEPGMPRLRLAPRCSRVRSSYGSCRWARIGVELVPTNKVIPGNPPNQPLRPCCRLC
jgi:hypothetical protein